VNKARHKILLIGCDGQVGWELQRTLAPLGELVSSSLCGRYGVAMDLLNTAAITQTVWEIKPDIIVNAAAHTAVDKAETEPDLARQLNAEAPGLLAQLAAESKAIMIHYSTDFVFSGEQSVPYCESDLPVPLSVYGKTKLEGEQRVLASGTQALIFRTSWVYGHHGHNFMKTMLRLFQEREQLHVVDDQIGAPTWSRMIAETTAQILGQIIAGTQRDPRVLSGIYHMTAGGETSWYQFAKQILTLVGADCGLHPITTDEYPTPAKRPEYSVLDNGKIKQVFGLKLPDWRHSLQQCIQDMGAGENFDK
jgi:dTDP-4-dehydrorhamnose reductase